MSLETRAFVGPRYEPESSPYFYDWTLHSTGDEIPALASGTHTLSSSVADGATTLTVTIDSTSGAAAADVPTSGGVWVAGNGSGQAWEYVQYSSATVVSTYVVTLGGCNREPDANREHNGAHSSGAEVRFFWELDSMSGGFRFVQEMDDDEAVIDWSAEASGWKFPVAALRDRHLFIWQSRDAAADPFLIQLVGFLNTPAGEIDYTQAAPWSVKITSSTQPVNRFRSPGTRRGTYNIGRGASVQAVSSLGAWWKERASGDYIEAEPDLSASRAVDGDPKTIYIAEAFIGTEPDHYQHSKVTVANEDRISLDDPSIRTDTDAYGKKLMKAEHIIISEVHLSSAVGQKGDRYVELTCLDDFDALTDTNLYLTTDNATNWFGLPITAASTGDKIIICENEDRFRTENPAASPAQLIDLERTAYYNFLNSLSTAGGTLALFYEFEAITSRFFHVVTWGTGGTATITVPGGTYTSDLTFSPALAVAEPGETYHYNYAHSSTAANNWDIGSLQTAGYTLDGRAWMLVELPPLGLMLAQGISDTYTGEVLLADGTGETTAGLASTDNIQIGDEIITYASRGAKTINITARGVSGTTAAAHTKDDPIYVSVSGIAVNAMPIRAVELVCNGDIVIADYTLRFTSSSYQPRTPDQANYTADYEASASVTGNTAHKATYNLPTVRRVRYLLLEFDAMSTSPARPRINEIRALAAESYFDADTWLDGSTTSAEFAAQLLTNVGFPSGGINVNTTLGSGDHATANRMAWDVVTAYAHYAGLMITVERDSKITLSSGDYMVGDIFDISFTWMRENTQRVKPLFSPPELVSQVKIVWQNRDGTENGTVYFPSVPSDEGEMLEMAEQVYDDEAQAQARAEKVYYRKQFPYTWVAEASIPVRNFAPGAFQAVSDWKLNSEMQAVNRLCMVKSVEHYIEQNEDNHALQWRTVVNLVEIQRVTG